jgi:ATP-dependent RNA helicase RhlE
MAFKALGLDDRLVQGILATGYTAPTEIQSRAIPVALTGKDIIGSAQTGTGKTAAFVLPILHKLAAESRTHHNCRALILTPTRELAGQIEEAVKTYGRFTNIKALSVYGGANMTNQMKHLQRGVDIVVATPGRLLDHLQRRSINLGHVQFLVVDEADRMFDMGFIDDVKKIVSHVPADRQTMMFSATMSKEIKELMSKIQKHPVLIEIGERRSPVESVRQFFYSVPSDRKMDMLFHLLEKEQMDTVLVFSRTKHGADKISNRLEKKSIKSVAIHSDRTQAQRERALGGFKNGQYRVLVATDVAARGIDVEGISHVVNYDIPAFPEDYIHRIGRTGRASKTGDAITFVAREEQKYLSSLQRFTGKKFDLKRYPTFDYDKPREAGAPYQKPEGSVTGDRRHEPRREHTRREERPTTRPDKDENFGNREGANEVRRKERPSGRPGGSRFSRDSRGGGSRFGRPAGAGQNRFSRDKAKGPSRGSENRFGRDERSGGTESKPKFTNVPPPVYEKKPFYSKFTKPGVPPVEKKEERDWKRLLDDMNERAKKIKKKFKRKVE